MLLSVLVMSIVFFLIAVMFRTINRTTSKIIYKKLSTYFLGVAVLLIIVMALIGLLL